MLSSLKTNLFSIMTNSLTVVAIKGIFKYIGIFAAKMRVSIRFFQQKLSMYLPYFKIEILCRVS